MSLFSADQPANVTLLSNEGELIYFLKTHYLGFELEQLLMDLELVAAKWGFEWSRVLIGLTKARNLRLEHFFDQETKEDSLTMTRTLLTPSAGILVLRHVELFIPTRLQGQGLSGQLIRPYYQQCRQANIRFLEVFASASAGGYAWARYGFAATQFTNVHNILAGAAARGVPIDAVVELRADFDAFYLKNPVEKPFPMRPWAELPFARALLVGTTWYGVLDLADPKQTFFFESYL